MWPERQIKLLKAEIETLLCPLSNTADFYKIIKEPLVATNRGLSIKGRRDKPWPLLPMVVCEGISGFYERALPVAATLQLLIAAGDVFDDVEDADYSQSLLTKFGPAIATNVATTLLVLAERSIPRLKTRGVTDRNIIHIIDAINSYYTTACTGQHLDLILTLESNMSEDSYLNIISMKSASQIECACYIGALLATTEQKLIKDFSALGHNLGMAAQIANDISGVIHGRDIQKKKITLPVIYAFSQIDGDNYNQLEFAFSKLSRSMPNLTQIKNILFRTGAIHYAITKMEYYKQHAKNILSQVEQAGVNTQLLKLYIE